MEAERPARQIPSKRARVVCQRCHEKKIRCDLGHKGATCTACLDAEADCEYRPSHKGRHRRKTEHEGQQRQNHPVSSSSTEHSAPQLPPVVFSGTNYVRALLGHQSELHGVRNDRDATALPRAQAGDEFVPGATRSYLETFSEILYTWCPIIDVDDSTMSTDSLLLNHSLASIASSIRPSLMPGVGRFREHYERARHLFYDGRQDDTLTLVKAALLLCCCDNSKLGSPTDGSFWWLGVAIRLAQSIRLHRSPRQPTSTHDTGLQRRIWWTLFGRERIMGLCQGRPCTIDESDCSLGFPQSDDFPESRSREGSIFARWVDLCRIMGQVNRHMSVARQTGVRIPTQDIAFSLTTWLNSLPKDLQLSIQDAHTAPFVRDVHLLHLPYLTTVALVYLNTTGQDVPEVSAAAVLAAGCIARVIGDVLLRGCAHTLPEDSGWFITIAITALMHVRPVTPLAKHATSDIHVLRTALGHLCTIWSSAKILAAGLDKILDNRRNKSTLQETRVDRSSTSSANRPATLFTAGARSLQDLCADDGVPWADFFPFATVRTSPLLEAVLTECQDSYLELWPAFDFGEDFDALWNEFVAGQATSLQDVF